MEHLPIHIKISDEFYLKDPESTDLGRKIVSKSIELIDELGFEAFTFKKLGAAINSTESSVYRYFESKYKLLVYLINWYWSWLEYKIVFGTINQVESTQKLAGVMNILTQPITIDNSFIHVNEVLLNKIVIAESTKIFHTKNVDLENKNGDFTVYKRIVQRVSNLILEVNSNYKYPSMLATTVIEGAHQQSHFIAHLPSLTDECQGNNRVHCFYSELIRKVLADG